MAALRDRYAYELFEISKENGSLERDLEHAILVRDTRTGTEALSFLTRQNVPEPAKRQLLHKAFEDRISWHLMGFMYRMVKDKREQMILPVIKRYIELINRQMGKVEAEVVSAKELSPRQIETIRKVLEKKTDMKVEIKAGVNPDVIGGFYVIMDGRIFDGTVRNDLRNMKARLKRSAVQ